MAEIKAIETEYNGYKFRSRLEARWAVFFDAMGIEYEYEREGLIGLDDTYYLPDFYLPKHKAFVEIKGSDKFLSDDFRKLVSVIDFNEDSCPIIILGGIPNPTEIKWGNIPVFNYIYWHKGVMSGAVTFCSSYFSYSTVIFGADKILDFVYQIGNTPDYWDFYSSDLNNLRNLSTKCLWTNKDLKSFEFGSLKYAYQLAFQARFEHGETPTKQEIQRKMREYKFR